ncbi:MAG: isocitrate lyase/PEP mutase family protein [Hyphomicrobiaceae bacterium]
MPSQADKGAAFRALHVRDGTFVIPNPWDVGSALILEGMGFEALATTSSGFANSLGRFDGQVTRDEKMEHCRSLADAVSVPVSADLENCFADSPEGVGETVSRAVQSGLAGCSVEDYTDKPKPEIYDFDLAVERVKAAVHVARAQSFPFTITARAEGVLRRVQDLDEVVRRLKAFEAVGADVLYAPGLTTIDEVRKVVSSVTRPVNVLAMPNFTVGNLAATGAKRISLGGWLARVATGSLMRAAGAMKDQGIFENLKDAASGGDIATVLKRGET